MSFASHTTPMSARCRRSSRGRSITPSLAGFGIPVSHIAVYEALRQRPGFQALVVRHEQAAGYAADGFTPPSGR